MKTYFKSIILSIAILLGSFSFASAESLDKDKPCCKKGKCKSGKECCNGKEKTCCIKDGNAKDCCTKECKSDCCAK